jgi:hypothetical protein
MPKGDFEKMEGITYRFFSRFQKPVEIKIGLTCDIIPAR